MNKHLVVWDPGGKHAEGAVVDDMRSLEIKDRGGATLPCVPEFFDFAGVSGYSRRAWGPGLDLPTHAPQLCCPLTMFAAPGGPRDLAWVARIVPGQLAIDNMRAGRPPSQGVLRMAAGEQRGTMLRPVVSSDAGCNNVVEVGKLATPDPLGGWTVYGTARLHLQGEGCCALALYGFAPGMRVAWLAATLTH